MRCFRVARQPARGFPWPAAHCQTSCHTLLAWRTCVQSHSKVYLHFTYDYIRCMRGVWECKFFIGFGLRGSSEIIGHSRHVAVVVACWASIIAWGNSLAITWHLPLDRGVEISRDIGPFLEVTRVTDISVGGIFETFFHWRIYPSAGLWGLTALYLLTYVRTSS